MEGVKRKAPLVRVKPQSSDHSPYVRYGKKGELGAGIVEIAHRRVKDGGRLISCRF